MNPENPSCPPFDISESLGSAENILRHLIRIGKRRSEESGADPQRFFSAECVLGECADIIRQAREQLLPGPDAGHPLEKMGAPKENPQDHPLVAEIQSKIIRLPGRPPAMLDRDLAEIYGTETKALNKAVKRNLKRFPENFRFQLTKKEAEILRFQSGTFKWLQDVKYRPWAYSREGSNMLSAVLHTDIAIDRSVHIMIAFSALEEMAGGSYLENLLLAARLRSLEAAIERLSERQDRTSEECGRINGNMEALAKRLDAASSAEETKNFAEARFLKEVCETRDLAARTPKSEVYDSYLAFCGLNAYEPAAKNHFFRILYRLAPSLTSATLTVKGKRTPVVKGLRLS